MKCGDSVAQAPHEGGDCTRQSAIVQGIGLRTSTTSKRRSRNRKNPRFDQ